MIKGLYSKDIVSSLVVFIVALPLSLGIAMASGVSPASGLIAAIVGGVLCGMLSGAPLVVAGPAAGMVAIVLPLVERFGLAGLAVITVIAGLIQLAMGIGRLGFIFSYVPKVVLHGMLSVIGFTIALYQLHVLMGASSPKGVSQAFSLIPQNLFASAWPILLCGAVALGIQVLWNKVPRRLSWIPGALPAVIVASALSLFWEMPRVEISGFLGQVSSSLSQFSFSALQVDKWGILIAALTVAIVASAESLLTAIAVDGLQKEGPFKSKANLNKELIAHGVSNSVSGFLGGIPITGVIVRSAVNINSGARTRMSTILHGLWIAIFVVSLPSVLNSIPLTALAAVLVYTGIKLVNLQGFLEQWQTSKLDASKWIVTFAAILLSDLLVGLIVGIIYSLVADKFKVPQSQKRFEFALENQPEIQDEIIVSRPSRRTESVPEVSL